MAIKALGAATTGPGSASEPKRQMAGSRQLVEKPPRLFQIDGVEALGEPAVNGRQEISGCCTPASFAPQPGEARRGAQLIGLGVLLSRDAQ
jgi:hypothetical protein